MDERLDDFLTVPELAQRLGRHPQTVRRWLDEPDGLPSARLGRTVVIRFAWVLEWLDERRTRRNPTRRPAGRGRAA